jgi:hypothetical protein
MAENGNIINAHYKKQTGPIAPQGITRMKHTPVLQQSQKNQVNAILPLITQKPHE